MPESDVRSALIALREALERDEPSPVLADFPFRLGDFFAGYGVPMSVETVRAFYLGLVSTPAGVDPTALAIAAVLAHYALGGEDA